MPSSMKSAPARQARRARVAPRARRGKVTDHASPASEDHRKADRISRQRAERAAKEAGLIKYLRVRDSRVFSAVTAIIRESRQAPAILPALAELVDYLEVESRRQALVQARRELRYGTTAEE